jgi:predicted kinase
MELIIFIGLQASGKSTFFRQQFATTHEHISKDLMPRKGKEQRQQQLIETALEAGKSIVVDNTNPSPIERASIIDRGKRYQATIIGYYFSSVIEECMQRNRQREGKALVPDVGFYTTVKKLEKPDYAEGFDRLFYVRIGENNDFIISEWMKDKIDGT